ncbi:hypothetical protein BMR04_03370 [Methylococcaceae bacterium HT3]|nr:hypothetical protein BMR04_03370 [Methylococcaceae bacterium HT3]
MMIYRKRSSVLRFFIVSLMVFGTSACSLFTQTEPEMSASEVCVKLNELVADHANDFKQFRGGKKKYSSHNKYANLECGAGIPPGKKLSSLGVELGFD